MSTKQLRQTIPAPTHALVTDGDQPGSDLGFRTLANLKSDLALNNVDNTSDVNKPISTATQAKLTVVGSAANQVPINAYLGKLAYQDIPYLSPEQKPVIPLTTPTVQDVIDALLALGLVKQED